MTHQSSQSYSGKALANHGIDIEQRKKMVETVTDSSPTKEEENTSKSISDIIQSIHVTGLALKEEELHDAKEATTAQQQPPEVETPQPNPDNKEATTAQQQPPEVETPQPDNRLIHSDLIKQIKTMLQAELALQKPIVILTADGGYDGKPS